MFGFGSSFDRRRARARRSARGALADYYAVDIPPPDAPAAGLPLLAIDLETTGLDAATDVALSLGFVTVTGGAIEFGSARHFVIRTQAEVGQSATLHGLTDDVVAGGDLDADVLAATLAALSGRVLLAHFARIEVGFLSAKCEELYGAPLVAPAIDTMELMHRLLSVGFDDEPLRNQLRLWNARARYGLPDYEAHSALTDALACAELFLAEMAELGDLPYAKVRASVA